MKPPKLKITLLTIILSGLLFYKPSFSFDSGDFQYWNTESASWNMGDSWKAKIEEEFRFGDGAGDFYYQHSDLGVTYSGLADWLDLGINYRQIFEKDNNNEWEYENRPHLNITLKGKVSDWSLSNRGRFEYRNKEHGNDGWRYRNKFTVKLPIKFTRFNIQPYIADEVFIDFDKEDLTRNRLYGGFSFKITKNLKGEIFYLWQSSKKSGKWSDLNVLGTKIKFSF